MPLMDILRYCFCIRATMHVLWSSLSYSEFCKLMTNWGFLWGFFWPPALLDSTFQDPWNSSTCHVKPVVKSSVLSFELLQIPNLSGAKLQISKLSKFCGRKRISDYLRRREKKNLHLFSYLYKGINGHKKFTIIFRKNFTNFTSFCSR